VGSAIIAKLAGRGRLTNLLNSSVPRKVTIGCDMAKRRRKNSRRQIPRTRELSTPAPQEKSVSRSSLFQKIGKHWGAAATVISLALGLLTYFYYVQDKKLGATSGVINPPTAGDIRYLSVGASRFLIDTPDGVFLRDGADPVLSMRTSNGRLLVSTRIRDSEGALVAELVENEWELNKGNYFDRNYTDQALEVRDRSGRVALQVAHFGDTVHLAGAFTCKNGWTNVMGPVGHKGAVMDIRPPGHAPEYSIPPIFEYPSALHFGSAPGLDSVKALIRHGPGPAYRMGSSLDICKKPTSQAGTK
jgi:hypothetical protein